MHEYIFKLSTLLSSINTYENKRYLQFSFPVKHKFMFNHVSWSVWRRQWHPTPVLLPGKCHGQRSLVGYRQWDHKKSYITEPLYFTLIILKRFWFSCIQLFHMISELMSQKYCNEMAAVVRISLKSKDNGRDIPGGPAVKNLPSNRDPTCCRAMRYTCHK